MRLIKAPVGLLAARPSGRAASSEALTALKLPNGPMLLSPERAGRFKFPLAFTPASIGF